MSAVEWLPWLVIIPLTTIGAWQVGQAIGRPIRRWLYDRTHR